MEPTNDTPKRRGNPNFGKQPDAVDDNKQAQVPAEPTNAELLAMVNKMMEQQKEKDREIEALKKSVDATAYNSAIANQSKDNRKTIKLRQVDGKTVISWSNMIRDDVRVTNGEVVENQMCELTFYDGTTVQMTYERAFNHQERTDWLPVLEKRERDGKNFYVVEIEGEQHAIEERFINA